MAASVATHHKRPRLGLQSLTGGDRRRAVRVDFGDARSFGPMARFMDAAKSRRPLKPQGLAGQTDDPSDIAIEVNSSGQNCVPAGPAPRSGNARVMIRAAPDVAGRHSMAP